MNNTLKLIVLAISVSGLAACSSAQKSDDSVLADVSAQESSFQDSESSMEAAEETASSDDSMADAYSDESTSLGTGSSGLGH